MTILVIILIIIGIALIIYSLTLKEENKFEPKEYMEQLSDRELSFAEKGKIRDNVDAIITEVKESYISKTDDELSQLSNEKIIAVNDFSHQILDKISQNHEEVIFLYNMLNEKQEELKTQMIEANKISSTLGQAVKIVNNKTEVQQNPVDQATNLKDTQDVPKDNIHSDSMKDNHNKKILELYSQGFSIIDISKSLEIGQGEVKLVIDLFKQA